MNTLKLPNIREAVNNRLLKADIAATRVKPLSRPNHITVNLSTKCNFRCPICSIHKAKRLFPDYHDNMITKEGFERMHDYFDTASTVSFLGLLGEPLLNPDFFKIVEYLKTPQIRKTVPRLFVSSNGQLLHKENREQLIAHQFERINFSLHGATEDSHKKLQGGNFHTVLENLKNLVKERNQAKSTFPQISVAHALNWWNIHELPIFLDLMKEILPDTIWLFHYRDYNGTINEDISLKNGDVQKANELISSAYAYAKKLNIDKIIDPQNPPYCVTPAKDFTRNPRFCDLPWRGLQLRGCIACTDSFYVGFCNVLNLFRLNYQQVESPFKMLWHHPLLMYIRETVNGNHINPICRYCRSAERDYWKSVDNSVNNAKKAVALKEFFSEFKAKFGDVAKYTPKEVTILEADPADIRLD